MAKTKTVLMCPPNYFDIEYEINVWMHQDNQPADETAHLQWQKLHDIYTEKLGWHVELIEPVKESVKPSREFSSFLNKTMKITKRHIKMETMTGGVDTITK